MTDYPLVDLDLSRRLELCEAKTSAAFVTARARLAPETGAAWIERAGAFAMFDGAGSPLTQTFGLGLFATPTEDDLAFLEQFFEERGAPVFHEISPIAGPETLEILASRGYRPVELTSMLYRPLARRSYEETRVRARIASADEIELWAAVAAAGWSAEHEELGAFMRDLSRVAASSEGSLAFIAELDGRPVATGALAIHDRVALLAGASTIPEARRHGAQRALLEARLHYAAEQGCDLAMMGAAPGSASQRNAERQGFRIAYTRIKWGR